MLVEGIIGRKVGMTQLFDPDGTVVPVTVLQAGPCIVISLRTVGKNGYEAAQLAFVEPGKGGRLSRPRKGPFQKANLPPAKILREFARLGDLKLGDSFGAAEFVEGELVDVTGTSKGLGFTGVMRRHGFRGGAASHGSMFHRAPGSIGASAFPSRTLPGMRAAGRSGGSRVTVKNLKVVRLDAEKNLVFVRGAVPGPNGTTVSIRRAKAGVKKTSEKPGKAASGKAAK